MSPAERLLAVQELDTRSDQLHHRRQSLEVRERLSRASAVLQDLDERLGELEARRDELARSQKRLEDEVSTVAGKRVEVDTSMYSGQVRGPRELEALQLETVSLKRRQDELEDQIIEVMELTEPVVAERNRLGEDRTRAAAELGSLETELQAAEAEIDAELAEVGEQRVSASESIDGALLDSYEQLRSRLGGVAVARLVGSNCTGCHLTIPAVEIDRIKRAPDNEVVYCDCGRMLVR